MTDKELKELIKTVWNELSEEAANTTSNISGFETKIFKNSMMKRKLVNLDLDDEEE